MAAPVAILFVDMADSTGLYERLGDLAAARLTLEVLTALRGVTETQGGRVVKLLGDGLLLTFRDGAAALEAAERMLALQQKLGVALRVGAHLGAVVDDGSDIYGDAVNVAARLEALARPGEILASEDFVRALPPALRGRAQRFEQMALKGKSLPIEVWRLVSGPSGEQTLCHGQPAAAAPALPRLQLRHGGRTIVVPPHAAFVIGREAGCDLEIPFPACSRRHAVITFGRDHFQIEDRSTNGTWLASEGGTALFLHRDRAPLHGRGLIGLGAAPTAPEAPVVRFEAVPAGAAAG